MHYLSLDAPCGNTGLFPWLIDITKNRNAAIQTRPLSGVQHAAARIE